MRSKHTEMVKYFSTKSFHNNLLNAYFVLHARLEAVRCSGTQRSVLGLASPQHLARCLTYTKCSNKSLSNESNIQWLLRLDGWHIINFQLKMTFDTINRNFQLWISMVLGVSLPVRIYMATKSTVTLQYSVSIVPK